MRIWILYGESDSMEIRITNDENYKHDPQKSHWNKANDHEWP